MIPCETPQPGCSSSRGPQFSKNPKTQFSLGSQCAHNDGAMEHRRWAPSIPISVAARGVARGDDEAAFQQKVANTGSRCL